jgi:hypothetical protein
MCRPKNIIKAVGNYLRTDGPSEGGYDNFDPVLRSRERYGVVKLGAEIDFVNGMSESKNNYHGPK